MTFLSINNLADRVEATNKTLAKFKGRAFDWKTGATCVHLLRAQLLAMGHKPPRIPQFRSALGARKALERMGHDNLAELLDGLLLRIPVSRMLVGDVALVPGEPPFDAVVIYAGGSKVIGWHGAGDAYLQSIELTLQDYIGAWRLG